MKNLIYILIIYTFIILSACQETIEVDLKEDENSTLIVEGGITNEPGKVHQITLKTSKDYYDSTKAPVVSGANVSITDGKNNYILIEKNPGIYETDPSEFTGEAGKTYILNITLPNGEKYKATETLGPVAKIDSMKWIYELFPLADEYFYKIMYYGQEPKGYGDYYLWDLYINNEQYNDTLRETQIVDDSFVDGNYVFDFEIYWLTEDELTENTSEMKIEIRSVSALYYDFYFQTLLQSVYRGGMFDPPPANVNSTNIIPVDHDKYAFGFFTASAVDSFTFTLIKSEKRQREEFDHQSVGY